MVEYTKITSKEPREKNNVVILVDKMEVRLFVVVDVEAGYLSYFFSCYIISHHDLCISGC